MNKFTRLQVRAAALASLPLVPLLGEGLPPPGEAQLAEMFVAMHDAHDPNVDPACALWQSTGCRLPHGYAVHLVAMLTSEAPAEEGGVAAEGERPCCMASPGAAGCFWYLPVFF